MGAAGPNGVMVPLLPPQPDPLDFSKVNAHIIHKARRTEINGHLLKQSFGQRLHTCVAGNTAEDRYNRARYESGQRVSIISMAEEERHNIKQNALHAANPAAQPEAFDVSNNERVQSRVMTQDHLRHHNDLSRNDNDNETPRFDANGKKIEASHMGRRNRVAARISRIAHWANAVTELAAAPTGLLLKLSKIFWQPKEDDRTLCSQVRALFALTGITFIVSGFSFLFFNVLWKGMVYTGVDELAKEAARLVYGVICSFSAVAFVSSLVSLAFSGLSSAVAKHEKLTEKTTELVNQRQKQHIQHVTELIVKYIDDPAKLVVLAEAMRGTSFSRKIADSRCVESSFTYKKELYGDKKYQVNKEHSPILLEALIAAVRHYRQQTNNPYCSPHDQGLQQVIKQTIGQYAIVKDLNGWLQNIRTNGVRPLQNPDKLLSIDNGFKEKGELLNREDDVLALTNLVEHARIEKLKVANTILMPDGRVKLDASKVKLDTQDLRTTIDFAVDRGRDHFRYGLSKLCHKVGWHKAARFMFKLSTPEGQSTRQALLKSFAKLNRVSEQNKHILENSHQYPGFIVGIIFTSEAIRLFSHLVLLSLNYLLTRPFAGIAGFVAKHVFHIPDQRCVSFSVGRTVSSGAWAVVDSFLFINLAAGNGVGLNGAGGFENQPTMPLDVGNGIGVSVISTGMQMLLANGLSFLMTGFGLWLLDTGLFGSRNGCALRKLYLSEIVKRQGVMFS